MKVVVATHPTALEHDTGEWHPERPARVGAVLSGVHSSGLDVVAVEAPRIDRSDLARVHDPAYVDAIEALCRVGGGMIDADTVVSPESWEAALRSAGAVQAIVEELESRSDAAGFAVSRPPGHHATATRAMGFCLFNNVAIAAATLRRRGHRVAVLDWDVHHGNGTQEILGDDPGVLFASIHQANFYPYEGHLADIERMAPGTTINIPLPARTGGDVVREVWGELLMPVVAKFEPDWVLVSAGFDAHHDDPIGQMRLTAGDYGWMASRIAEVASPNRVVFALEGGYDLDALEASARTTLRGLAGEESGDDPLTSPKGTDRILGVASEAISKHW